jgi:glyoxylase-like metal-dependent hydrolase (beta-lactamase superfamily II)
MTGGIAVEPVQIENGLWRVAGMTNGYLICRGDDSLLIDCPRGVSGPLLAEFDLPAPSIVLHTQVQCEHCYEWESFPTAEVHVPQGTEDLAMLSPQFVENSNVVWGPDRDWSARGAEPYGIAGCLTARPPARPLSLSGTLVPGTTFRWKDVELEVVALPGSGQGSIGLFWKKAGVLFGGDLIAAGGYLVNLYDIERSYGIPTGYDELRSSLATATELAPALICPTTGPTITDPAADIAQCSAKLSWLSAPPVRREDKCFALANFQPAREFGNYREVLPGLCQQTNYGNIIVYVGEDGDAVMIDPGPCYWKPTWEEGCQAMVDDLDLLERETGLKKITAMLVTHFHGDHVENVDVVRARYGAKVLATPDVAAAIARPEEFPYPCRIPWYGFPFKRVEVDGLIEYGKETRLGSVSVTPVHTPGHCYAHAGFIIPWAGEITACTGDVIQYGDGPIGSGLPIIYNDTGTPERGLSSTCRSLARYRPTILVGGHSFCCKDPDGSVLADFAAVADGAAAKMAEMVAPGNLEAATTPPGFAEARVRLTSDT